MSLSRFFIPNFPSNLTFFAPLTAPNMLYFSMLIGLGRQVMDHPEGASETGNVRLGFDRWVRQVVGGRAVDAKAASASQMGRFETEVLATTDNRTALADMSGNWIDRVHERKPPKWITLDMDSSVLRRWLIGR